MWDILHSAAGVCDEKKVSMNELLKTLDILLPCIYCRESYKIFRNQLGQCKKGEAVSFMFDLHNLVNQKLRKQRIEAFQSEVLNMSPSSNREELTKLLSSFMDNTSIKPYLSPTLEIVKKRYCVNRDDLFTWKSVSISVLAMCKGQVKNHFQVQNFSVLSLFLKEFHGILLKAEPASKIAENVFKMMQMKSVEEIISSIEMKKPLGDLYLMEAGACMKGTCI